MPGLPARALAPHDRGEEAGPVPGGRVQRGGSPQSTQVLIRAPQSSGRKGTTSRVVVLDLHTGGVTRRGRTCAMEQLPSSSRSCLRRKMGFRVVRKC